MSLLFVISILHEWIGFSIHEASKFNSLVYFTMWCKTNKPGMDISINNKWVEFSIKVKIPSRLASRYISSFSYIVFISQGYHHSNRKFSQHDKTRHWKGCIKLRQLVFQMRHQGSILGDLTFSQLYSHITHIFSHGDGIDSILVLALASHSLLLSANMCNLIVWKQIISSI